MKDWTNIASDDHIKTTMQNLAKNGMQPVLVDSKEAAKQAVLDLVPKGAEIMTMTSVTLDAIGISQVMNESGEYNSVRAQLNKMDRATQGLEMQKLGAAPEWALGSVHALTQDGKAIIASNTGSQLPAYAYGSPHVIWVVGAQKIVTNQAAAMQRLEEYVLPKEDERARQAYGRGSNISKLLIINKEVKPDRITIIIVKEALGF